MGNPSRSTLVQDYDPEDCGIYRLYCESNGKSYVGSSFKIDKRVRGHFRSLERGDHSNSHLQNGFNLYGIENFSSWVLEICPIDELFIREQVYIDQEEWGLLFNQKRRVADVNPHQCVGLKHSEEVRKRMSEASKKRTSTKEFREMVSERAKRQHAEGLLGRKQKYHSRICEKCGEEFSRIKSNGKLKGYKNCLPCMAKTHAVQGGRFDYLNLDLSSEQLEEIEYLLSHSEEHVKELEYRKSLGRMGPPAGWNHTEEAKAKIKKNHYKRLKKEKEMNGDCHEQ